MKTKFIAGLALVGIVLLGWLGFKQYAFSKWEATLAGPFYGSPFHGLTEGPPASTIVLPDGASLEVYQAKSVDAPVLSLRSATGSNLWSRFLIPEDSASDGSKRRGHISEIRLQWIRQYGAGFKVYALCDWNWGGHEAGLIYLKPDYSFRSFSLGW